MDHNGDVPNCNIYIQDEKLLSYKINNNIGSIRAPVLEQNKLLENENLNEKSASERILKGENDIDNKMDRITKVGNDIGNEVDTPWSFAIGMVSFVAQVIVFISYHLCKIKQVYKFTVRRKEFIIVLYC